MNHFEWNWVQEGNKIYAQGWNPPSTKAVVCLIHGFGEHSTRFAHVAEHLASKGFATLTCDLPGHGKTEGKRGYVPSYDTMLDSVKILLEEANTRFPGVPKFLYGHSMGGAIATNYVLTKKPAINGLVATSPLFKLGFEPPAFKLFLAKLMRNIYPKFTEKSELDTNAISRDKEEVRKYETDPLVHGEITVSLFFPMYENGLWDIANANLLSVPMLLMHGSADKLTSPKGSEEFAQKAPADLLTYKSWGGFYHEMHNEPEPDRSTVLNAITDWLNSKL